MRLHRTLPSFLLILLLALVLGASAAPLSAAPAADGGKAPLLSAESPTVIDGQYIVVFRKGTAAAVAADAIAEAQALGATVDFTYSAALSGFAGRLDARALDAMRSNPAVDYVEADQTFTLVDTQPNATWGLDRIDQRNLPLNNTYVYNYNGTGVTAYIIDTGMRVTHNEFGNRVAGGYTAINDGNGYNDCNGHGTHVAGTVGGTVYGVAKNVTYYAVRVLNCGGSGSTSQVISGVDWVTSHHSGNAMAVANMSLGGSISNSLDNAVRNSIFDGVVYAVAAGNSNANACNSSPARVAEAITVGATDSNDNRASFSNYGSCVDIFAPGVNITSAWYTSNSATNTISGTSMASPHVAGVAALFLDEGVPTANVFSRIIASATPGVVGNPGSGSPNLLLYSFNQDGGGGGGPCDGPADFAGTLSGTGDVDYGWYYAASGTHQLCLEGTGPDFDLYLLKRGIFGGWSVVASSLSPDSSESISYNGSSGYYLWYIRSYQGSGSWELWVDYP